MSNAGVRIFFCFVLAVSLGGCSKGGGVKTYPASGVLTFKGQPLAKAVVTFFPASGRPVAGMTDEKGEFTLLPGATAGPQMVAIGEPAVEMKEGDYSVPPEVPPRFPAKYTDPNQSGLQFEVQSSAENKFTIELKE